MALKSVFFDVGETLVDEERWWRVPAERAGLQPHVIWAALGVTIERGEEHNERWARDAALPADVISSSESLGVRKPDPRFRHAWGAPGCASVSGMSGMDDADRSLIERWLRAGDEGDLDQFDEFLHPDVRIHAPLGLSTEGREAEKAVWREALAAMPDLRHAVQEVVAEGRTVVARVVVTGTLAGDFGGVAATGRRFEIDQVVFAHVRDGKVEEIWEIADTGRLLQGEEAPR